jgi:hypothetical protein
MAALSKRKVISDKMISEELYAKALYNLCSKLERDNIEVTQHNIIKILLPMKFSNTMIAVFINDLIPEANATRGSVATQINYLKRKRNETEMLLDEIEKGFN